MNQGIERNMKQADRGQKTRRRKELEHVSGPGFSVVGLLVAGKEKEKTHLPFKFIFTLFSASPWWVLDRSLQSLQGRLREIVGNFAPK